MYTKMFDMTRNIIYNKNTQKRKGGYYNFSEEKGRI